MKDMVTLVNLSKVNNIVSAEYYCENNETDKGYIEYDIEKKKVIKCSYCQEDAKSHIKYGASKAAKAIEILVAANRFPEKYRYIWY